MLNIDLATPRQSAAPNTAADTAPCCAMQRTSLPAATYNQGGVVQLQIVLTANHGGKFYFRVCPRRSNLDEACFGTNYLTRWVRPSGGSTVHGRAHAPVVTTAGAHCSCELHAHANTVICTLVEGLPRQHIIWTKIMCLLLVKSKRANLGGGGGCL